MVTQDEERREESSDPATSPVSRIRRAHKGIAGLLDELDGRRTPERNAEILKELGEVLPSHFADEEAPDGLFEHLRARRPRIHEQLTALREEHRSILEILQTLRAAHHIIASQIVTHHLNAQILPGLNHAANRFLVSLRHHHNMGRSSFGHNFRLKPTSIHGLQIRHNRRIRKSLAQRANAMHSFR